MICRYKFFFCGNTHIIFFLFISSICRHTIHILGTIHDTALVTCTDIMHFAFRCFHINLNIAAFRLGCRFGSLQRRRFVDTNIRRYDNTRHKTVGHPRSDIDIKCRHDCLPYSAHFTGKFTATHQIFTKRVINISLFIANNRALSLPWVIASAAYISPCKCRSVHLYTAYLLPL